MLDMEEVAIFAGLERHRRVKAALAEAGIRLTPLLLIQVDNDAKGATEPVKRTKDVLTAYGVDPQTIAVHTSGEPDPFFHTRSVHRFCTILSSLQRQITSHMTTLDIEIAACQIPTAPTFTTPELRALDIQARIERLRACGWKRARFNVQRYETLRENALADMV